MARPKRVVLLYCDYPDRLSELSCLLHVRGYNVMATSQIAVACRWLINRELRLDCLVVDMDRGQALVSLAGIRPELKTIWMAPHSQIGLVKPEGVDYMFLPFKDKTAALIDCLKSATTRKRGPRGFLDWFSRREERALESSL